MATCNMTSIHSNNVILRLLTQYIMSHNKGVWVWFGLFFMFSEFYQLYLHDKARDALAHLCLNICKKTDWKLDTPLYSFGYWNCMFVDFFITYMGSSQLWSLLSVDYLLIFEHIVQSLIDMCFYDVYSLILTKPHTNQIQGSNLENNPLKTHLP
jgi:hypothetical protein